MKVLRFVTVLCDSNLISLLVSNLDTLTLQREQDVVIATWTRNAPRFTNHLCTYSGTHSLTFLHTQGSTGDGAETYPFGSYHETLVFFVPN